jgi:hypothetical protein
MFVQEGSPPSQSRHRYDVIFDHRNHPNVYEIAFLGVDKFDVMVFGILIKYDQTICGIIGKNETGVDVFGFNHMFQTFHIPGL